MTKEEQFKRLFAVTGNNSERAALVDYDEDVLKEVYTYLVDTGQKEGTQRLIWDELRMRDEARLEADITHFNLGWRRKFSEEWTAAVGRIKGAKRR